MSHYFPLEVITEILHRLPFKSRVKCISVCKSWKSIITSHSFIISHLKRLQTSHVEPSRFFHLEAAAAAADDDAFYTELKGYLYSLYSDDDVTGRLSVRCKFPPVDNDCRVIGICNGLAVTTTFQLCWLLGIMRNNEEVVMKPLDDDIIFLDPIKGLVKTIRHSFGGSISFMGDHIESLFLENERNAKSYLPERSMRDIMSVSYGRGASATSKGKRVADVEASNAPKKARQEDAVVAFVEAYNEDDEDDRDPILRMARIAVAIVQNFQKADSKLKDYDRRVRKLEDDNARLIRINMELEKQVEKLNEQAALAYSCCFQQTPWSVHVAEASTSGRAAPRPTEEHVEEENQVDEETHPTTPDT